jgi:hypothetical protein
VLHRGKLTSVAQTRQVYKHFSGTNALAYCVESSVNVSEKFYRIGSRLAETIKKEDPHGRHDIRHNDSQHNYKKCNSQHNYTRHKNQQIFVKLVFHFFMLSVSMLSAIMLSVNVLSAIMLSVIMLRVLTLSVLSLC